VGIIFGIVTMILAQSGDRETSNDRNGEERFFLLFSVQ
jgi:hypothetical protein